MCSSKSISSVAPNLCWQLHPSLSLAFGLRRNRPIPTDLQFRELRRIQIVRVQIVRIQTETDAIDRIRLARLRGSYPQGCARRIRGGKRRNLCLSNWALREVGEA